MKIYVAHSSDFEYQDKLYLPIQNSVLAHTHDFFFPHEGVLMNTKEVLKSCDLLIAEVSVPSTGEGIEIGRAEAIGVPVVFLFEKGSRLSSSLEFVSDVFIEYETSEDLLIKLEKHLLEY